MARAARTAVCYVGAAPKELAWLRGVWPGTVLSAHEGTREPIHGIGLWAKGACFMYVGKKRRPS